MEANPCTFEAGKFKAYRARGSNRLSIGIQSFNSQHLQALARIHDGDESRRAIDIAASNFDNFNIDLMYALPSQTMEQVRHAERNTIAYEPTHLWLYHLTMEANTDFAKYQPVVVDDDARAEMQEL